MPRKARPKISLAQAQAKVDAQKQRTATHKAAKEAEALLEVPSSPQKRQEKADTTIRVPVSKPSDYVRSGLIDAISQPELDPRRWRVNPRDAYNLSNEPDKPRKELEGADVLAASTPIQWWRDRNQEEYKAQQAGKGENTVLDARWYSKPEGLNIRNWFYAPNQLDTKERQDAVRHPETLKVDWSHCFVPGARQFILDTHIDTSDEPGRGGQFLLPLLPAEAATVARELRLPRDAQMLGGIQTHGHMSRWDLVRPDEDKPWGPDNWELLEKDSKPEHEETPVWINATSGKKDAHQESVFKKRIQQDLFTFVHQHGDQAIAMLKLIRTKGLGLLLKAAPDFAKSSAGRDRLGFHIGPALLDEYEIEPHVFHDFVNCQAICTRSQNHAGSFHREVGQRRKPGKHADHIDFLISWPLGRWKEFCLQETIDIAMEGYLLFHAPWRLKDAEKVLGEERLAFYQACPSEAHRKRTWRMEWKNHLYFLRWVQVAEYAVQARRQIPYESPIHKNFELITRHPLLDEEPRTPFGLCSYDAEAQLDAIDAARDFLDRIAPAMPGTRMEPMSEEALQAWDAAVAADPDFELKEMDYRDEWAQLDPQTAHANQETYNFGRYSLEDWQVLKHPWLRSFLAEKQDHRRPYFVLDTAALWFDPSRLPPAECWVSSSTPGRTHLRTDFSKYDEEGYLITFWLPPHPGWADYAAQLKKERKWNDHQLQQHVKECRWLRLAAGQIGGNEDRRAPSLCSGLLYGDVEDIWTLPNGWAIDHSLETIVVHKEWPSGQFQWQAKHQWQELNTLPLAEQKAILARTLISD